MKKKISRILGVGVTLALMTSLLVGALPAAALSAPTVTIATSQNIISQVGPAYTVRFTIDQQLKGTTATITLTFPSDTAVASGAMNVNTGAGEDINLQATDGWVDGNPNTPAVLTGVTATGSATARTITLTLAGATDAIGEGAEVRIVVDNVLTNPSTPGDYTLTVRTSAETTAVTSNVYSIVPPSLYYPGNIEVWNPGGYLMGVETAFMGGSGALSYCTSAGYTLKVSSGYYDEDITVAQQVTIEALDGATPVIADLPATDPTVGGTMIVTANKTAGYSGVIVDGLTFMGWAGADVLTITGEGVTVQNCIFTKYGTATTTVSQTMVDFQTAAGTYPSTISNCTFDTTLGSIDDVGISASGDDLTISGCTFTGDGNSTTYVQDYYIQNTGGTPTDPNISTGNTATGAYSGTFLYAPLTSGGTLRSTGDTMSGLWRAVAAYGGTTTISDASVTSCGIPASSTLPNGVAAVQVGQYPTFSTTFTMTNSTVSGSLAYGIAVGYTLPVPPYTACPVDLGDVTVMFNEISNTKNVYSESAAAAPGMNFTHNWWGDADGPAADSLGYKTGATTERLDTSYPLGAPATGAFTAAVPGTGIYSFTTQGVSYYVTESATGDPSPPAMLGAAVYASNPAPVDTPRPTIEDGFYDVFIGGPLIQTDVAHVTITNPNVDETTIVYIWNNDNGVWGAADVQGTNTLGGSVWFETGLNIWPPVNGLCGTPVALAIGPLAAPAQSSLVPAVAAENVRAAAPSFTWAAVAGADSYNFELSEYPDGDVIVEESVEANGLVISETLDYLTTYSWRVQAVRGDETSIWSNAFFTTAAEVLPDEPDTWVIEQEPTQIEWPDDITVVVPPIETTEIPEYILWVVVAVGAILVIAVVVLIVRTRRVA